MRKILLLSSLVLLLACFGGCRKDKAKEKDKEKGGGTETVAVATPRVETVTLTQNFPGNLQAQQEVEIVARVNGVLKIHAASGSRVKKGQLLYSIDDSKYLDEVKQAESAIASAEATLKTAQANYAYYQKQYAAMQKAYGQDAVSEIEMLESKNNLDQSLASIDNANATIAKSKAALAEAQTMLGYCQITAPFDGTLSMQTFDQDAYINGETTPVKLNTIYNDQNVYAFISVDEKRYAQMMSDVRAQGLKLENVKLNFNVPLQHEYYSTINYQAPNVSTSTGTVTLRFDVDNRYSELKSGMYMNVMLPYGIYKDALLVKDASIGTDQAGKYMYLVNDDNIVIYTPVEVGELYNDTLRIINKGLTPQSRYVTEALLKVRDGMKVKVK